MGGGLPAIAALLIWLASVLSADAASAQELSPRAYWPVPTGTKVALVGYTYSFGDVLTDPSLPIVGVDSRISTSLVAYGHSLNLWGRMANLLVELPFSWGTTKAGLEGDVARRDFSGVGDLGVTLAVNLRGAPSMTLAEFRELRENPHPILGASVKILVPIGRYEANKLINVGANRWAVKAELGYMNPVRPRWLLELQLGAWFFGDNDDFLGMTREQQPVVAVQGHLVRRFRSGFWGSLDLNYFAGGRSTVGGEARADLQRNSRFGATVMVPIHRRHGIKLKYSLGVVTETGGDFDTLLMSYQVLFR